ncbi:fucolectin-like [Leptodactylus fuscus]|uniref:fucolectin-like n=1 Tax=Leptodactylus fuscus TaxID=238119 RepID=UPI003F4E5932
MFLVTFIVLWISVSCSNDKLQNAALRGRATHSTNLGGLSAAINAIDGNVDPNYKHGSCFCSQSEHSPWWRVDLLETYRISHVTITNRGDCCESFINGAEILIGDSLTNHGNNNPRCGKVSSIPQGASQNFLCPNMEGRYVNIFLPGKKEHLTFCEVEVVGIPANPHHHHHCKIDKESQLP